MLSSAPALMVGVEEPAHWRGSSIFIMGGGAVLDNTSFIMNNAQCTIGPSPKTAAVVAFSH